MLQGSFIIQVSFFVFKSGSNFFSQNQTILFLFWKLWFIFVCILFIILKTLFYVCFKVTLQFDKWFFQTIWLAANICLKNILKPVRTLHTCLINVISNFKTIWCQTLLRKVINWNSCSIDRTSIECELNGAIVSVY